MHRQNRQDAPLMIVIIGVLQVTFSIWSLRVLDSVIPADSISRLETFIIGASFGSLLASGVVNIINGMRDHG